MLVAAIDAYLAIIERDPNVYRFLLRGNHDRRPIDACSFQQRASQDVASRRRALRAAGLDSGDAEPWAHGIVGMVNSAGVWWIERRPMPQERLVEYVSALLWERMSSLDTAVVGAAPELTLLRSCKTPRPRRRSPHEPTEREVTETDPTQTATTPTDLSSFNPLDDGVPDDPYPLYERLRAEHPVHRIAEDRWLLTRYEDCADVLRRPEMSSAMRDADDGAEASVLQEYLSKLMLFSDAPDHTRLRGLVSKAFTPRVVEGLRPRVVELVDELLDEVTATGGLDVIAGLGRPLPVTVIAEMLGVPAEDHARFRSWSEALAHTVDPNMAPERAEAAAVAGIEFMVYFLEMTEERRQRPRDDLLSALAAAEDEGDRLSADELVTNCILLLIAGHETTTNLIGNGTLALLRNPDELARFQDDPALAKTAVEELLRYDSPVHLTGRVAMEDVVIGGTEIRAGERITLLLAAANRDPAAFAEPDRLDFTRNEIRHLAFSSGPHFCLGAALARLEGQVALSALVTRFPDLHLASEDLEWNPTVTLRGLKSLPLEV